MGRGSEGGDVRNLVQVVFLQKAADFQRRYCCFFLYMYE
jgi:hypothetical protein